MGCPVAEVHSPAVGRTSAGIVCSAGIAAAAVDLDQDRLKPVLPVSYCYCCCCCRLAVIVVVAVVLVACADSVSWIVVGSVGWLGLVGMEPVGFVELPVVAVGWLD